MMVPAENIKISEPLDPNGSAHTNASRAERIREALRMYTSLGLRVHPCHHVLPNGENHECCCDGWRRRNAARDRVAFEACPAPGKQPYLKSWQKLASADPEQVAKWWTKKEGGWPHANLGIATGEESGLFVFDVDGEEGKRQLAELIQKNGPLPHTPTVLTGSGGFHYWFRWPEGLSLRNTAKKIASSLDSRANGGQVIAPPSIHKSGREYEFLPGCSPAEVGLADMPDWLLALFTADTKTEGKKPSEAETQVDAGRVQNAIVRRDSVDAEGFEGYLALIGDGDGMEGFDKPIYRAACSWMVRHDCDESTGDELKARLRERISTAPKSADRSNVPRYESDSYLDGRIAAAREFVLKGGDGIQAVAARVDGFNGTTTDSEIDALFAGIVALKVGKKQADEITKAIASKTGRKPDDLFARSRRAYIIAKLKSGSTVFESEEEGIEALNAVAATVLAGSTFRVIVELPDDEDCSFRLLKPSDASYHFAHWRVVGGTEKQPKLVPLFPIWMASADRRRYENIVFDPSARTPNPKCYNLWKGLKIAPPDRSVRHDRERGDCRLLLRHMFAVLCGGDAGLFEWLMAWNADLYQDPARKKGVALVLNSPERGTGKSTLGNVHQRILGRHAQKFFGSDSLTGQFNAALAEALLVVGEEVLFSGDRKAANVMKAMITEDMIQLERKHVDKIQVKSHSRYLLISNDERAAPAETGTERRYFILRVGSQYAKIGDLAHDEESKDYFDALYHEIDSGGASAFLEALLAFNTSRVNLRNPPKTKALADQIEKNLRGGEKWLFDVLASGAFVDADGETIEELDGWEDGPVEVSRSTVFKAYNAVVSTHGQRREGDAQIGAFLRTFLPDLKDVQRRVGKERPRYYVFPSLAECRDAFQRRAGVRFSRDAVGALNSDAATMPSDRWTEISRIDVNPSDDLWYEAGRLMQMDAAVNMVLSPDTDNSVGVRDDFSDGGFAGWFYANAPAGMGASAFDLSFGSWRCATSRQ